MTKKQARELELYYRMQSDDSTEELDPFQIGYVTSISVQRVTKGGK